LTAGRHAKRIDLRIYWSCGGLKYMQQDLDGVLPHLDRISIGADFE
jgi:hypothetical protein